MDDCSAPLFASAERPSVRNTDLTESTEPGSFPRRPSIVYHDGTTPLVDRPFAWWTGLFVMFLDCWFQFCSLKYHPSRTIQTIWRAAMCSLTVRNGQF